MWHPPLRQHGLRAICALHLIRSGSGLPMFYPERGRKTLNKVVFLAEHFR